MSLEADELILFRKTLRHVIDTRPPHEVPGELREQGWLELMEADPAGAITALGEEAGAARSRAPVVDLAVLWGIGRTDVAETAIVYDELVLSGVERARTLLRITQEGLEEVPARGVTYASAGGFDPALGLQRAVVPSGAGDDVDDAPDAAVSDRGIAAGRRALASQMVGASSQMLDETLAYVSERRQYGRAIGSFQTVKHRLADVKVAITAARASIDAAWAHVEDEDGAALAIAAKCLAGRAQQLASTHCFQVHGGIAFAVEHGFQQWVRRGLLLDHLLGGHAELTRALGRELIARRSIPRVPNLF